MNAVRKLFRPWKVLIAAVAICVSAAPARADLYLQVIDQSTGIDNQYHISGTGGSGTTGTDFTGFTVNYVVSSDTTSGASLKLNATVDATAAKSLKFVLLSSSGTGSTPTANPTTGYFTTPLANDGQQLGLYSTVKTSATDWVSGSSINTYAGYTAYDGSTAGGIYSTPTDNAYKSGYSASLSSANGSATSNVYLFNQTNGTTSFDLRSISTELQVGAGKVGFEAQAIAVPEPTGVLAALAGLPCLGLLVGFARRRRALATAASAV